jgi:hypothetical protein
MYTYLIYLLYTTHLTVQKGRWAALYFAAYMLFCSTIILDVLISVVIEGFRVCSFFNILNFTLLLLAVATHVRSGYMLRLTFFTLKIICYKQKSKPVKVIAIVNADTC